MYAKFWALKLFINLCLQVFRSVLRIVRKTRNNKGYFLTLFGPRDLRRAKSNVG